MYAKDAPSCLIFNYFMIDILNSTMNGSKDLVVGLVMSDRLSDHEYDDDIAIPDDDAAALRHILYRLELDARALRSDSNHIETAASLV